MLAIQPNMANPQITGLLQTFGMIAVLIIISLAYAKFVMPAVLFYASKSVELMMVLSLAWCFFIGCTAILPFVGLSMELASLIAGAALATFVPQGRKCVADACGRWGCEAWGLGAWDVGSRNPAARYA